MILQVCIGYCPHTVTVYNRASIEGLIYLYYEYYPTVTECGAVSKVCKGSGLGFRVQGMQQMALLLQSLLTLASLFM